MRRVMLLALLIVMNGAGCAYTVGPDSSWSEIRSAPNILIQAPMIRFGAHAISVLEVCRSGDRLRAPTSDRTTVEVSLGTTTQSYNIEVDRLVDSARRSPEAYLFTKHFDIPTCGEPAE